MNIYKHSVFTITEWDGSQEIVKIADADADSVTFVYGDGLSHAVSRDHFLSTLKPRACDARSWGPRITAVDFEDRHGQVTVSATTDDGASKPIFSYFSDELSFSAVELVGKTVEQAMELRHNRDVAYLRS